MLVVGFADRILRLALIFIQLVLLILRRLADAIAPDPCPGIMDHAAYGARPPGPDDLDLRLLHRFGGGLAQRERDQNGRNHRCSPFGIRSDAIIGSN